MATKQAKAAKEAETQSILDYFAELPDPRRDNENKRHKLIDILAISILASRVSSRNALIRTLHRDGRFRQSE